MVALIRSFFKQLGYMLLCAGVLIFLGAVARVCYVGFKFGWNIMKFFGV